MNLRDMVFGVKFNSIDTSPVKDADKAMDDLKDSMVDADKISGKTTKSISEKFKSLGDSMGSIGKKMTLGITTPLVALGGLSYKMAADTEDAMGATEQIFKNAANSMKSWSGSLPSYYGVAKGEALEYSNTMGSMLKNIGGLTEEQAAKQSQTLIELSADLSAMFGGSTQDAVHALTGALKGNNSMLDNYGMGVNDATVKAKAFEMGLSDGSGELTLQAKQGATLALIMEQTADAQGQAAREAEGASGSMKSFSTTIKDLRNSIGEVLLPIITPLLRSATDIMIKFKGLSPTIQENIVKFGMVAAAIGPVILIVAKAISVATKLGTGIAFIASPIGLVIVAVAALGVAIWAFATDAGGVTTFVKKKFGDAMEWIRDKFAQIGDWFKSKVSDFKSIGSNIITSFISGFTGKLKELKSTVTGAASNVGSWFKDKLGINSPSKIMIEAGLNTGEGVAIGLQRSMPTIKHSTNQIADSAGGKLINNTSNSINKEYRTTTTTNKSSQGDFKPTLNITVNNPKDTQESVRVLKKEWENLMAQYNKRNNLRLGDIVG